MAKIAELDGIMEDRVLSDKESLVWAMNKHSLEEINMEITQDLKQEARIKWSVEGDETSSFFHGMINQKFGSNRLGGILVNDEWLVEPNRMKWAARKLYATKYNEPMNV